MPQPDDTAEILVELHRGPFAESQHRGHAVVVDHAGTILGAWGDPSKIILPRSSSKMIQALPLIESGAADHFGLSQAHLALSCASHNGAKVHTDMVAAWLDHLGLQEADLRCGPQMPDDRAARENLIKCDCAPDQGHNNCSGKHSGFLTLNKHLGGGSEYIEADHPVQKAVLEAFEDVTGETSAGYGIDGCSAPNFACSLLGLGRAMARYAGANPDGAAREAAMAKLHRAMANHPILVAGEGRACTDLMEAMGGHVAVKTGAEAVFVAIIPEKKIGIALKIEDGGTRASEAVITQLLIGAGVLDAASPVAKRLTHGPITNRRDIETGFIRPVASVKDWRLS